MGLFNNLTTEGLEDKEDRLGGYSVLATDAYKAVIKLAYAIQSQGGAHGVVILATVFESEEDTKGKDYSETIYITNKEGQNYFLNKNDNTKKVPLPGFTTIDDLCLVTTDKPLSAQDTEEKVVNIYDYDAKKEVPQNKPVLVDLLGKEVYLGIVNNKVDKTKKNDQTQKYEPTGETREENSIEKVFHFPTKMTVSEASKGVTSPVFYESWVGKNKGVQRDRSSKGATGSAGGQSGRPGQNAPTSGNGGSDKPASLFGKK